MSLSCAGLAFDTTHQLLAADLYNDQVRTIDTASGKVATYFTVTSPISYACRWASFVLACCSSLSPLASLL